MPSRPTPMFISRFGGNCGTESKGKYLEVETVGRWGSWELSVVEPGILGGGKGKLEGTGLLIMLGLGYWWASGMNADDGFELSEDVPRCDIAETPGECGSRGFKSIGDSGGCWCGGDIGVCEAVWDGLGGGFRPSKECLAMWRVRYVSCVYDLPQTWQMCVFRCFVSECFGMCSRRLCSSEKHL